MALLSCQDIELEVEILSATDGEDSADACLTFFSASRLDLFIDWSALETIFDTVNPATSNVCDR